MSSQDGGALLRPSRVAVIGSGPAGWTAALYLARAQFAPVVFEGELNTSDATALEERVLPGGQLMTTTEVENYPGFPGGGISGPDLMMNFQKQAEEFGAITLSETVTRVTHLSDGRGFQVDTRNGKSYEFESLVIATGATAKYLGLESETRFMNKGVSACATCDGALPRFRRKPLVVVGGGDTAMEEALFLSRFASQVYLVHRRDAFRASAVMAQRAISHEKITVIWNSVVEELLGTDAEGVTGVRVRNVENGEEQTLEAAGFFAAIGHQPNSRLFEDLVDVDAETGYIQPSPAGTSKTKTPGLFVAGDVADSIYRQAVTAAGSGCMAGIDATRYLESQPSRL